MEAVEATSIGYFLFFSSSKSLYFSSDNQKLLHICTIPPPSFLVYKYCWICSLTEHAYERFAAERLESNNQSIYFNIISLAIVFSFRRSFRNVEKITAFKHNSASRWYKGSTVISCLWTTQSLFLLLIIAFLEENKAIPILAFGMTWPMFFYVIIISQRQKCQSTLNIQLFNLFTVLEITHACLLKKGENCLFLILL